MWSRSICTFLCTLFLIQSFMIYVLMYRDPPHQSSETMPFMFSGMPDVAEWQWRCKNGKCEKLRNHPQSPRPALSLISCKMLCNKYGLLWPRPTGEVQLGNFLSNINLTNIRVEITKQGWSDDLMHAAAQRFKDMVAVAIPKDMTSRLRGNSLDVHLVNANPNVKEFSLDMDESYTLSVAPKDFGATDADLNATIVANTFFGLRHGLETLAQLFIYDEMHADLLIVRDVWISDKPVYPYRGILLDTARNYYTVQSIKNTLDAMAAVKLNTFHWHITDTQSFPFESARRSKLSKIGALSPRKVYTKKIIKEVVQYALERGVRVLPEFDAPAHVGEGWQDTNLTVCFGAQPWRSYCVEPPCGQLNPTKDELYEYLEDIYTDMAEAFVTTDLFHMGGDEVSERCWSSSESIRNFMAQNEMHRDSDGFLKLWNYFQKKAQESAYKKVYHQPTTNENTTFSDLIRKRKLLQAFGKKLPLILWTSKLTDYNHIDKYLRKEDYIIQVWTSGVDPQIHGLLEKGYRLIMSNYDALYLDCGFGSWVGSGNNWCSPYISWQKVYENSPEKMALRNKDLILGGEAALWSEQSDTDTMDSRLWPRAAALAERLWAEPATKWENAVQRILHIRERLVLMGIQADSIQPEWCYQNEGSCELEDEL